MKRTPLRRRSPRMEDLYAREGGRRDVVQRVLEQRPVCEAGARLALAFRVDARGLWEGCQVGSVDVHEIKRRSAGGSIIDESNLLAVCRRCHAKIHAHPREARYLGLLRSRYGELQ